MHFAFVLGQITRGSSVYSISVGGFAGSDVKDSLSGNLGGTCNDVRVENKCLEDTVLPAPWGSFLTGDTATPQ